MEIEGAKETYPDLWEDIRRFQVRMQRSETPSPESDLRNMITEWKNEEKRSV
jgi:hypothetical protein